MKGCRKGEDTVLTLYMDIFRKTSNLNDLEMIFSIVGKSVIKLCPEGNSYRYLDLIIPP